MLPVIRPLLPSCKSMEPYLREIDAAQFYSNYGPLHQRLEIRLAEHFGVPADCLALASSGTVGLIAVILAVAGRAKPDRPLMVCPAYTFAASAAAAEFCGYTPFFADIDPATWALDPVRLESLPQLAGAGAVMAVAPYGRAVDVSAWQEFSARTGLPVVVDAAACFDTIDARALARGGVPAVVSLHATKAFSTAEGGLILGGDASLVERAVRALNFGFAQARLSLGPGLNGKLSEYHAAVGLAELDGWNEKRDGFRAAARTYAEAAARHGLRDRIFVNMDRAVPYVLYLAASPDDAGSVMSALERRGVASRLWYGPGMHRHPYFRDRPAERLPVTDDLAPRLIGLPFAPDIPAAEIERVLLVILEAARHTRA